jgi:2-amino-4-hydroxy-6-hydroxymethyldihydropteridine diphosphokinase
VKKQDISENLAKFSYISIGSNLGNRINNIEKTKFELEQNTIQVLESSSNYKTKSWPDPSKPYFLNVVIKIKTNLTPLRLLKICNSVEMKLGRIRSEKNAPRTCDIDIIDYDQKKLNDKINKLILPHPRMNKRNFVLLPLFELNKSWKHAKFNKNIVNLINSLPIKDLRSIKRI